MFDCIVVGGAMNGAAFALDLANRGFDVAVIERTPSELLASDQPLTPRVSALSIFNQQYLSKLGVWQLLEQNRICPYTHMHVWDAGSTGDISFDRAEISAEQLGYILENEHLQSALFDQLRKHSNVQICQASVVELHNDQNQVSITLNSNEEIQGRWLVGADGARSTIRQLAGIPVTRNEFGQQAIVCHIRTERPHQNTAWQRFLPSGPLALLPLPDGRCSIVWSAKNDLAQQLLAMTDAEFGAALTEASESRLGAVLDVEPRLGFPLASQHAKEYVHGRVVLIGDAAHTVHPLAGQGVNLGLKDAAELAELFDKPGNLLDTSALRSWERSRKSDNHAVQKSMQAFDWMFSNTNPVKRLFRGIGLDMVNHNRLLKTLFMRQAT